MKVAILQPASRARLLTYSGVVRARIESPVGFRVAGKVMERLVNVGDRVSGGQVIARLDDTDLKLAEKSAEATVNAARTRRDVAKINLDRAKPLLPQGFISKAAYDLRRNEMDAAASALETAEANLQQAANAVAYATLKSDASGIVTSVTAEPGQVLSAGQPIITLADDRETEIAIAVPEQEAGRLSVGRRVDVKLWAGTGEADAGRIREIGGQADAASRTYAVRISVASPPETMRLGMTASVAIAVEDKTLQMVVPLAAVTESEGSPVVFIVDRARSVVRRKPVALGIVTDAGVGIVSGVEEGDMVVSAGVQFLRDGMRVAVPAEVRTARTDPS